MDASRYIGKGLVSEGCQFTITKATRENNHRFTWVNVVARWAGYGPRPVFADEDKRFLLDRQRRDLLP